MAIQAENIFATETAPTPHPRQHAAKPSAPVVAAVERGGGRRVCHGAPATTAQDHSVWRFSISRYNTCNASS